jgi:hypothetical protein
MRIYVVDDEAIIEFDEGTGDNLLDEDIEAGYVDYVYYTVYDISDLDDVREIDGGMMLLEKPFREAYTKEFTPPNGTTMKYFDDDELARDVLDMAGYSKHCEWRWL